MILTHMIPSMTLIKYKLFLKPITVRALRRKTVKKMKFSMIIISIIASLSMQVQAMTIRDRTSELNVHVINPLIVEPMNKASFKAGIRNSIGTNQDYMTRDSMILTFYVPSLAGWQGLFSIDSL